LTLHFAVSALLIFSISTTFLRSRTLRDSKGAVVSFICLGASLALGAWSAFLGAHVRIVPEILFGAGLAAITLFLLLIFSVQSAAFGPAALPQRIASFFVLLFRMPVRRPALLLLIAFSLSPIAAARIFKENQSFADFVTATVMQLRAEGGSAHVLREAFPGLTFQQPMYIQFQPSDPTSAYVIERGGRVYRVQQSGTDWSRDLILDLRHLVGPVRIENGVLGLALHPDFGSPAKSYAFIYYTDANPAHLPAQVNRISRFDLSRPTPEERLSSEFRLIEISRDANGFHNGGTLLFGPDGYLYISTGDANTPAGHQRIDQSLFGGILRIDVNAEPGSSGLPIRHQPEGGRTQGYLIPPDNPFVDSDGALGEFFALGLRNPFRMSLDAKTGTIWIGDVGNSDWEEVNVLRSGGNYQFPYMEGTTALPRFVRPDKPLGTEVEPFFVYEHTAQLRAVIGGVVYRGNMLPELAGSYLFADNYSGQIFAIPVDGTESSSVSARGPASIVARARQVAQQGISSVTLDPQGEALVTTLGRMDAATGRVWRIAPAGSSGSSQQRLVADDVDVAGLTDAALIYGDQCARCHGSDGMGRESMQDTPMPDYTNPDYHLMRSDEDLHRIIAQGGDAFGLSPQMPPWNHILRDEEITAVVEYLRELPYRTRGMSAPIGTDR